MSGWVGIFLYYSLAYSELISGDGGGGGGGDGGGGEVLLGRDS